VSVGCCRFRSRVAQIWPSLRARKPAPSAENRAIRKARYRSSEDSNDNARKPFLCFHGSLPGSEKELGILAPTRAYTWTRRVRVKITAGKQETLKCDYVNAADVYREHWRGFESAITKADGRYSARAGESIERSLRLFSHFLLHAVSTESDTALGTFTRRRASPSLHGDRRFLRASIRSRSNASRIFTRFHRKNVAG